MNKVNIHNWYTFDIIVKIIALLVFITLTAKIPLKIVYNGKTE